MKALSIRQPWAWLIVNGHKNIENRNWPSRYSGPLGIHAGKGMTREEYFECEMFVRSFSNIVIPSYYSLERGGVVGTANMTGCACEFDSPWFVGEYGFVLTDQKPVPFIKCNGALGFFNLPKEIEALLCKTSVNLNQ